MMRLDKKLVVLRAEQEAVREEGEMNEALGARVSTRISAVARPAESSKYRLHVEEVGKITSLLLGLSGRLARAENALYGMPADHAERVSMNANFFAIFVVRMYYTKHCVAERNCGIRILATHPESL